MPTGVIDYDRGVHINIHQASGMDVFMYVDEPGKFYTAHGNPVPDEIAKQAGFDVEKLAKERVKQERKQKAMAAIDDELADEKNVEEKIVEARNGFQLIAIGLGRHILKDPDGNTLTGAPLPFEAGKKLLETMAGPMVNGAGTKQADKKA